MLNDLSLTLLRFRLHRFGITTDIEKSIPTCFCEEGRDVKRFLWLIDPSDVSSQITTYKFKAVLFGATCSPFILNATLLKHLQESEKKTAKLPERDLNVDNILTSVSDEDDALTYFRQSRSLVSEDGFNLRAWTSNSQKVRELAEHENVLDKDEFTNIQGMRRNYKINELFYPEKEEVNGNLVTNREICRYSSRIYNLLGFLNPVKINANILM